MLHFNILSALFYVLCFNSENKKDGFNYVNCSNNNHVNDYGNHSLKNYYNSSKCPNSINSFNFLQSNYFNVIYDSKEKIKNKIIEDQNDSNPQTQNNLSNTTLKIDDDKINSILNSIQNNKECLLLNKDNFDSIGNQIPNEKNKNNNLIEIDDSSLFSESYRSKELSKQDSSKNEFTSNEYNESNEILPKSSNYVERKFGSLKIMSDELHPTNNILNIDSSKYKNSNIDDDIDIKLRKDRIEEKNSIINKQIKKIYPKNEENQIYNLNLNNHEDLYFSNREKEINKKNYYVNKNKIKKIKSYNNNYNLINKEFNNVMIKNSLISEFNIIHKNKRYNNINIIKEETYEETERIEEFPKLPLKYNKFLNPLQNSDNSDENSVSISSKINTDNREWLEKKTISNFNDDYSNQFSYKFNADAGMNENQYFKLSYTKFIYTKFIIRKKIFFSYVHLFVSIFPFELVISLSDLNFLSLSKIP